MLKHRYHRVVAAHCAAIRRTGHTEGQHDLNSAVGLFNSGHTSVYQFTDPGGMDGLVDRARPGIRTRVRQTRDASNQAARDRIHSATQTDQWDAVQGVVSLN